MSGGRGSKPVCPYILNLSGHVFYNWQQLAASLCCVLFICLHTVSLKSRHRLKIRYVTTQEHEYREYFHWLFLGHLTQSFLLSTLCSTPHKTFYKDKDPGTSTSKSLFFPPFAGSVWDISSCLSIRHWPFLLRVQLLSNIDIWNIWRFTFMPSVPIYSLVKNIRQTWHLVCFVSRLFQWRMPLILECWSDWD